MREKIFNVFMFAKDGIICEMGIVSHERDGSDKDKLAFLQSKVRDDYRVCRKMPLPDWCEVHDGKNVTKGRMSYVMFNALTVAMPSKRAEVVEPLFKAVGAPHNPLMVTTFIVDGHPRIEAVIHH